MKRSFGTRRVLPSDATRLPGRDEGRLVDIPDMVQTSLTRPDGSHGPLGLQGGHREVADLIRRSEGLAVSGDLQALKATAGQVVTSLKRHIEEERASFRGVDPEQYRRLIAGQQALIDSATRFATHPAADAGADLLALLVRQADTEEASIHGGKGRTGNDGDRLEFTTDWAMAAPLSVSP